MNAATVVVEILVAGMGALVWFSTLLYLIFSFVSDTDRLGGILCYGQTWPQLAMIMVLGLAYVLGVMVDRAADFFLPFIPIRCLFQKISQKFVIKDLDDVQLRFKLLVKEHRATFLQDYVRSSVRVLRASTLNILLIGIFGSFLILKISGPSLGLLIFVVAGLSTFFIFYWIYYISDEVFQQIVELCNRLVAENDKIKN